MTDSPQSFPQSPALAAWLARRQLAMAALLLLGTAGLLWAGRIGESTWADVTLWTFAIYAGGEVGAAAVTAWKRTP